MSILRRCIAVLVVPFLVIACSDSNNSNRRGAAELRVTHASADAPAVNVYVDGALALEAVPFKASSGLLEFADGGTIEVEVRGILPDRSEVTVIGPVDLSLRRGERTDVVAVGNLFDDNGALSITPRLLDPVTIESDITDVRVSVLHAAPEAGTVDIYVTSPGDDLANNAPITAAFNDAAGPVMLEPDIAYQVRITPQGSSDVVFDSGSLTFDAGTELVLVAVENTYRVGPGPVTLVAVGADGAGEVLDVNQGGAVRIVHNSADTPPVDVLVNGALAIDALAFPNATMYGDLEAPAGTYNVVVAADADNTIAPIDVDVTVESGRSYTAIAVGSLADGSIEPVLTEDDRRHLATAARVEVIHGSYTVASAIPVDVFLTADGVIADAAPAISGLAYKESTGQLEVTPGAYWVTVTAAGDKSIVAFDSGAALDLAAGVNYTVIARDPSPEEGIGAPLINVTLLID